MPLFFVPCCRRIFAFVFACLLLATSDVRAGIVRTFGGDVIEGEVRTEPGAVTVTPKGLPPRRVELADILRAEFQEKEPEKVKGKKGDKGEKPTAEDNQSVQLRNGTIIGGKVTGIDDTAVHLSVGAATKDFPLADVARILFDFVPDNISRNIPAGFIGAILPGGDLMEGEFRGVEDKPPAVRINSPILGIHRFNYKAGEILAVSLHDLPPTAAAAYHVRAVDGSVYNATTLSLNVEGVSLHDLTGAEVRISVKQIAHMQAGDARYQLLGPMRATTVNSTNAAKVPAAFTADAMPGGGPIKLAGQAYDAGIVQSAGVAVTYAVPPGLSIFVAKIGLPDGAPAGAAVFYTLLADNRPVWRTAQPVVAGAAPIPVRWNLGTSIRAVTLYVEPALPVNLGTSAAWVNATLLKP